MKNDGNNSVIFPSTAVYVDIKPKKKEDNTISDILPNAKSSDYFNSEFIK